MSSHLNDFYRERHPLDMRREYRDAPPDFANDWSRDRYDGYDTREYDRRGDNRGIPVDYERHFDGDRLHPDRGDISQYIHNLN